MRWRCIRESLTICTSTWSKRRDWRRNGAGAHRLSEFQEKATRSRQGRVSDGLPDHCDDDGSGHHGLFSLSSIVPKFESIFHDMLGDKRYQRHHVCYRNE